jgi:hypothetical protein
MASSTTITTVTGRTSCSTPAPAAARTAMIASGP